MARAPERPPLSPPLNSTASGSAVDAQPCDKTLKGNPKKKVGLGCQTELAVNAFMGNLDSTSTVVYFATFSLIFLFVSSVGALCMHYSLKSFNALFGGVSSENAEHAMPGGVYGAYYWMAGKGEWRPRTRKDLADQRQRIRHAQVLIGHPTYRAGLMENFFSEFADGYAHGLHDRAASPRRLVGPDFDTLDREMHAALDEAGSNWTAAAIEERLPDVELRRSLGYNPDGAGSPFGYVGNLVSGRRQRRDEVIDDLRDEDMRAPRAARINTAGNVRPIAARRSSDGEVA